MKAGLTANVFSPNWNACVMFGRFAERMVISLKQVSAEE